MKPNVILIRAAAMVLCGLGTAPLSAGDWASDRVTSFEEIFRKADLDRNNNLNGVERDKLRLAFSGRPDLRILDQNQNGKLDREEIDFLEKDRVKKTKKKKDGKKH